MHNVHQLAHQTRLLIMDVDGVLTDGKIYFTASGEEIKAFNTLDGHGLGMLRTSGVALAIISGRAAPCVEHRARQLGIAHIYLGVESKLTAFNDLLAKTGIDAQACAYIGDDLIDLPVMRRVGFSVAVPEAPNWVRSHAHYVTGSSGGNGAVRELCELIMHAQGTLEPALAAYLA